MHAHFNSFFSSSQFLLSADNLCKQLGPRSGPTKCRSWSGSKQLNLKEVSRRQQKLEKIPSMQRAKHIWQVPLCHKLVHITSYAKELFKKWIQFLEGSWNHEYFGSRARDPKYSWFHEPSKNWIYCLYLHFIFSAKFQFSIFTLLGWFSRYFELNQT